jgi:hypothetical protein
MSGEWRLHCCARLPWPAKGSHSRRKLRLVHAPPHPPALAGCMRSSTTDTVSLPARKEAERPFGDPYGTYFTDRLPKVAEAVCSLAAESALIDGEAVAFRSDGHSDIAALCTKAGSARAFLVAFDLLNLNGEDFRQRPLEERRDDLSRVVHGVDNILFSEALSAEGALVFAKACRLGPEGIVSKRAGSQYRSGGTRQWLKSKNPAYLRE